MPSSAEKALAPPAQATKLEPPDLVRLIVGSSSTFAGNYPPDAAHRGRVMRAASLREMELNFTTAQQLQQGGAKGLKAGFVRGTLGLIAVALLMLGLSVGAGVGWWLGTTGQGGDQLRAGWRVQAILPGQVVIRVGERLWPIRQGDQLPNGDRVLLIDDKSRSMITESGTFKLEQGDQRPIPEPPGALTNRKEP